MKINLQLFATMGVFPVHNNVFKIGIAGRASVANDMKTVKDLETFSPAIDANTEEWTPMDTAGWIRRAVTGKGLSFSFTGKRNYGDAGNDYIAGLLLKTGQDVETKFEWTLPNGDVFSMNCIVNLTTPAGGDSTNIDTLEFEVMSDGLPSYTSNAALPELTFVCEDHATAGATKIMAVVPALTGGNSYLYKVNGGIPVLDADLTGLAWAAYVLGDPIPVVSGNKITLIEVSAALLAKKGGQADAVVS
jgi:hypothetical protein